jgi:hypothetical protein
VEAEIGSVEPRPRRAVLFGPQHPADHASQLSANELIVPLAEQLAQDQRDWRVEITLKEQATKERLQHLLGGDETPALLFTASHGMNFPNGDTRQLPYQGALLCQDWPGPTERNRTISRDFYFAAEDVGEDARLQGLVAFFFAPYGAGTPRLDDFGQETLVEPPSIAPHSFIARLPKRLLGHPKGGALAVIGHVDRNWFTSFLGQRGQRDLAVFRNMMNRLMAGYPVGAAMDYFGALYADYAATLIAEIEGGFGRNFADPAFLRVWTATKDVRNYVIIGDPAVRPMIENEVGRRVLGSTWLSESMSLVRRFFASGRPLRTPEPER